MPRHRIWPLIIGVAVSLLGLTVMFGWHSKNVALVQILPTLVPMQYNTALCFLLAGLCVGAHCRGFRNTLLILLIPLVLLPGLTLLEYLFNTDLGIDQLFMQHFVATYTPHPGRMAPNTALCFLFVAITLAIQLREDSLIKQFSVTFFGGIVLSLAAVALFGYVTGLKSAFAWGQMTHMALHTALGFLSLGVVLLWGFEIGVSSFLRWFLFGVLAVLVLILVSLQQSLGGDRQRSFQSILDSQANLLASVTQARLEGEREFLELSTLAGAEWIDNPAEWLQQVNGSLNQRLWSELWLFDVERSQVVISNGGELPAFVQAGAVTSSVWHLDGSELWAVGPAEDDSGYWYAAKLNRLTLFNSLFLSSLELGVQPVLSSSAGDNVYRRNQPVTINDMLTSAEVALDGLSLTLTLYPNSTFFAETKPTIYRDMFVLAALAVALLAWLSYQVLLLRRKETTIKDLYQRQVTVFNTMIDGLVIIDDQGVIKDINEAALVLFGYQREEMVGANVSILMPQPYRGEHDSYLRKYRETGVSKTLGYPRLLRAVRKDGSEFPAHIQITRGEQSGEVFFTGVVHDLSELSDSESRREEQEALLNAAVHTANSSFAIVNNEARFIQSNDALAQWLGYTKEEVLGLNVETIFLPEKKDDIKKLINDMLKGELDVVRREDQYRSKDGKLYWGLLSATTVRDNFDRITHIVLNIVDIEEFKQLSLEMERRSRALEVSNAELEQFAYVASHDLKEPVRTLSTFSSYLIQDLDKGDKARIREDVTFIESAAKRMSALIDDLLALSRAGSQPFAKEAVDLNQCVEMVRASLATLISESRISFKVTEDLPTVIGDDMQLQRVFQNLITNGIKFRKKEGSATIDISVESLVGSDRTVIVVADNGIGIAKKSQEEIFLPFKKLHSNVDYPGTGIGLAIVKRIIERHNGTIEVRSKEGEGTRFMVTLPKAAS